MLSFQLFFKEKRGTRYDPEVLRNLYLDFKNSGGVRKCHFNQIFKYDNPLLLKLKKLINSLVAEFRTRSRSSITDVDGYHRTTFFESLKC